MYLTDKRPTGQETYKAKKNTGQKPHRTKEKQDRRLNVK